VPRTKTLTCYLCNEPMWAGTTSKPQGEAAHNKCRRENLHGESAYRRGCRCDECREAINAKMRAYAAKRKQRDGYSPSGAAKRKKRGVDPAATWDCCICKKPLKNAARSDRPMHKECRSSAPEWLRKGLPNPKIAAFRKKIERAAKGTSGGKRVFIVGGCSWCGEYVIALGKYCSDKCKTLATFKKRSSGKTFKISPKKRNEIYERDGWTCQLCFHPVDQGEHYLSDYAASLDHIIPQSMQLIPDHSPSNLRLVHRWCNSARGDGTNMSKDVLIARATAMHLEAA